MQLTKLKVANYKSLRDIEIATGALTVVVGANAAGKSNLADFHDFLADLYRHGLAVAVARKGGYENIAHRKMRRSRGAITIDLTVEIKASAMRQWPPRYRRQLPDMRFSHSFSFRAESQSIRSDFRIESERIVFERRTRQGWDLVADVKRRQDFVDHWLAPIPDLRKDTTRRSVFGQFRLLDNLSDFLKPESLTSTELLLGTIGRFVPILRLISDGLSEIRVFQLSPTNTREFGVPIPNPEMDRYGGNLPAVVDMMVRHHGRRWMQVLAVMRQLIPTLVKIEVDYTHSRTLGLYFYERGVGRPWTVSEVSDGTIHSLALLVALYDPRTMMLVLEEPENSIHTWILRVLMSAAVEAAEMKQILFTTHSKTVVDAFGPADIWVMWRSEGESHLKRLLDLDADIVELLEKGDLTTFELLDTGFVPEALPPSPDN